MEITLNPACPVITTPAEAHALLKTVLDVESPQDRDQEHFWVFHLSARQTVQALHLVSLGTLTSTLVHPREVFTRAIADRCASIIIAHNHPSGTVEPSAEDKEVTQQLVSGGKLLGIEVIDHLIISGETYYSFKQAGTID